MAGGDLVRHAGKRRAKERDIPIGFWVAFWLAIATGLVVLGVVIWAIIMLVLKFT